MREEALRVLAALGVRGDKCLLKAVAALARDSVVNVRVAACEALRSLTDPGLQPTPQLPATGTSRDVVSFKRDRAVIAALQVRVFACSGVRGRVRVSVHVCVYAHE